MKVKIIGGDSFIAGVFIDTYSKKHTFELISRISTKNNLTERVLSDFFMLDKNDFNGVDVVINFAAIVHNPKGVSELDYYKINHELTIRNALLAKQAGVKQFIQLSTIAVYGGAEIIDENTNEEPHNPYGKSKLLADIDLLKMQDEGFKVQIIRPSMVYGGGKAPGNLQKLLKLVKLGIPLPFKGIKNKRNFLNVHTLCSFIDESVLRQLSGIYVLADQQSVSTSDLITMISLHLGIKNRQFRIPDIFLKVLKYFIPSIYRKLFSNLVIDSSKAHEVLNNNLQQGVTEGIQEMINSNS